MLKEKKRLLAPLLILAVYAFTCGVMIISFILKANGDFLLDAFEECSLLVYSGIVAISIIYDRKINISKLLYLAVLAFFYFVSVLVNGGGFGSILAVIVPLVLLYCFEYGVFDEGFKFLILGLSVFMIIAFYFITENVVVNYMDWFFYYSTNPNVVGISAVMFFMIITTFVRCDDKYEKAFIVVAGVMTLLILLNVKARAALICMAIYCAFIILPKRIFSRKIIVLLLSLIVFAGFLIPIVYLHFYEIGAEIKLFGKNLYTGREEIWDSLFNIMNNGGLKNWLFGVGSKIPVNEANEGIHNDFYSLVYNFGFVGFLLLASYYVIKIKSVLKHLDDIVIKKSLLTFTATCMLCWFETIIISSFVYVFIYFSLGMAINRSNSLEEKDNWANERAIVSKFYNNLD